MSIKGKITSWNDSKAFGFITPVAGGKQVFIHITAFKNHKQAPAINQLVTYSLSSDKQGRPCATMAHFYGKKLASKTNSKKNLSAVFISLIFFSIITASIYTAQTPLLILPFYLLISLVTFIVYAVDKSAAQQGNWRMQESSLHMLALAGGWPGALMAQQIFRHKSKKQSFRFIFWITVLLNICVFAWFHTPSGTIALNVIIELTNAGKIIS